MDAGLVWHHGNPVAEARAIEAGSAVVDLLNREVVEISGPDRLGWMHSLTSQHLESLEPGESFEALVLSPNGHIEHVLAGLDDGERMLAWTEPGRGAALVDFLERMRFMMRVEVGLRDDLRLAWAGDGVTIPAGWAARPALGGREVFRPADAPCLRVCQLGCGLSTRTASPLGRRGSSPTPMPAPSRMRSGCSGPTSTRAAIAARRPWPAFTTWAARPVG